MNTVQEIWLAPGVTIDQLLVAAAHGCYGNDTLTCQTITAFLAKRGIGVRHPPMATSGNDTICATYHHGADYVVYLIGDPELVLDACRLSENAREKALLESRRLGGAHAKVYSIARGDVRTIPQGLSSLNGLTFYGHITVV